MQAMLTIKLCSFLKSVILKTTTLETCLRFMIKDITLAHTCWTVCGDRKNMEQRYYRKYGTEIVLKTWNRDTIENMEQR